MAQKTFLPVYCHDWWDLSVLRFKPHPKTVNRFNDSQVALSVKLWWSLGQAASRDVPKHQIPHEAEDVWRASAPRACPAAAAATAATSRNSCVVTRPQAVGVGRQIPANAPRDLDLLSDQWLHSHQDGSQKEVRLWILMGSTWPSFSIHTRFQTRLGFAKLSQIHTNPENISKSQQYEIR